MPIPLELFCQFFSVVKSRFMDGPLICKSMHMYMVQYMSDLKNIITYTDYKCQIGSIRKGRVAIFVSYVESEGFIETRSRSGFIICLWIANNLKNEGVTGVFEIISFYILRYI